MKFVHMFVLTFTLLFVSGCENAASVASRNIADAAENFEIQRRIVFINGITDKYLLSIEGLCSIEVQSGQRQLEVTCKTGAGQFKKHHLGLSDNTTYFSEQLDAANVSEYHYRVMFRPATIVPDVKVDL